MAFGKLGMVHGRRMVSAVSALAGGYSFSFSFRSPLSSHTLIACTIVILVDFPVLYAYGPPFC